VSQNKVGAKPARRRLGALTLEEACGLSDGSDRVDIDPFEACRVCGCTALDCRGCIERTGSPCYWVEPDLRSACVGLPR
jgi:hypothetical protein